MRTVSKCNMELIKNLQIQAVLKFSDSNPFPLLTKKKKKKVSEKIIQIIWSNKQPHKVLYSGCKSQITNMH